MQKYRFLCVCEHDVRRGPMMMAFLRHHLKTLNIDSEVESAGHLTGLVRMIPVTSSTQDELVDWGLGQEVGGHRSRHLSDVDGLVDFNHYVVVDLVAKKALVTAGVNSERIHILNGNKGGIGALEHKNCGEYSDRAKLIDVRLDEFVRAWSVQANT